VRRWSRPRHDRGDLTLPHELLRDSEATLRIVDTLLGEVDARLAALIRDLPGAGQPAPAALAVDD
jgi:hypothetical protein